LSLKAAFAALALAARIAEARVGEIVTVGLPKRVEEVPDHVALVVAGFLVEVAGELWIAITLLLGAAAPRPVMLLAEVKVDLVAVVGHTVAVVGHTVAVVGHTVVGYTAAVAEHTVAVVGHTVVGYRFVAANIHEMCVVDVCIHCTLI